MRNAVVLLLLLGVGALGILAYSQNATIQQKQQSVQGLTVQLQDTQAALKATTLDLQGKCARQAYETFKNLGWDKKPSANYGNHYHSGLSKCFILIEDTNSSSYPGRIVETKFVLDAFEGASYGYYQWISDTVKKYWEVKPIMCDITLLSGEKVHCQSQGEFDEWVKGYMGSNFP